MLNLKKCTLDPKGNKKLTQPLRTLEVCNAKQDCATCGWNKDVIAKREAQYILSQMKGVSN